MTEPTQENQTNIFLFFGTDNFSSNQKLKFYQNGFSKKYGEDSSVEILDGAKLDLKNFETDLQSLPFLSEKKLVIIKDFFDERNAEEQKQMAKIITKTPDFCVLFFYENAGITKTSSLYKKITQIGKVEEFTPLSPQASAQWIMSKAKKENVKISIISAKVLADHVSDSLWALSSEYEKVKTFANGEEITKEMIEKLVSPTLSASIFHLTDSIAEKRQKEAISILQILEESEGDVPKIFFMIVRHFRLLIQVSDMLQRKEPHQSIIKKLALHPFIVTKMTSQSKNFTEKNLIEIYKELLKIDTDFKTGQIKTSSRDNSHHKLAIEKFIIDCCKKN
ncbi:DNA polymerase III subunit delta [Candidatus Peregrinibacteria bacterium CG_4_10_14_0_2_um_filter_38_24]|nr:MAG: DNA polymerase III subunit delta [Candidatus Peregrinibacteria bacterium CG_4_10_14_0_2_um_filter_38_24]PJC38828.1 MAG: DNA polymerase III subunit delta [Candidatus Peregrinibacteria bacterium CG_4_9_14_0_2_um_filter_38_9]